MSGTGISWKIKAGLFLFLSACFGILILLTCLKANPHEPPMADITVLPTSFAREPIQPLSAPVNLDSRKVRLGRELFHDPRLSANNSVSCARCHDLQTGGVDRRTVSVGIYHRQGARNAPTVFNSGMNYRQFWDARAMTLEEQVNGPLQAEAEMGSTWDSVVTKLRQDAHYAAEFSRLYPEKITPETVRDAIAVFERSLVTPDCCFDRYLKGENKALTPTELAGYRLFKTLGCVSCHQGRNIGGGMMQPFGVLKSPSLWGEDVKRDTNRERENSRETLYRVPSLRNVARTAPYFHDGSADSLPKAVMIMSDAQLCRHLSKEEVRQIVAFLQSLTGTYEGKAL